MVRDSQTNPCTRCGKQRIVVDTIEEYVGESLVVTTVMSCPDPECQQKVDNKIEKERLAREKFRNESLQHSAERSRKHSDTD